MTKRFMVLFIVAMAFITTPLSAQPPDTVWTRVYGGPDNDEGYSVWETADGGFIVSGRTNTYGGGYDIWLLKLDANGDTLWTRTYGGADRDLSYSVMQTPDGGYIIGGCTETNSAGGEDFCMVKTDSLGVELWTKTYGGPENDELEWLVRTPDGGYAMTGKTNSYGMGNGDFWLVKTDSLGDTAWTKTYGGAGNDRAYEVQPTADGGYILTGWIDENGLDVYVVKTDEVGDVEWERNWGQASYDGGEGVAQTPDGGYIVAAGSAPAGEGSEDIWLIRIDSAGDSLWTRTYGGLDIDWSYGIELTYDDGYIITGTTNSYGAGDFDVYVVRTDTSGDTLWTATYGGAGYDECYQIRKTSDDGYILVGITDSYGAGENDVYIIRLEAEEKPGVEEAETKPALRISTCLNRLLYDVPGEGHLHIYSVDGRLISSCLVTGSGLWEAPQRLPEGVYFIHLSYGQSKETVKLIVSR